VAAATEDGICLLEFSTPERLASQLRRLERLFGREPQPGTNRHLDALARELAAYFAGALRTFTVPVLAPGTTFQQRVWAELLRIPYGQTRSYGDIACAVSGPQAQRAVGRANGTNRVAIVIPCHRVVNKDGTLGGYGGELWRKALLLRLEGARGPAAQAALPL
jgi:AraC family transcriptional regulator of adaptative response/methylated-DNA-[protein]-cysteine methyltransferase